MNWLFLPSLSGATLGDDLLVYWLPDVGTGSRLTLSECAAQGGGQPVRLVLPMECCSALAVRLPTQKSRWLRQALPYAVEELLAEDVEQLHLALGEQLADGRHRVIAIRRDLLAGWLRQLSGCGLLVAAIYCDADLLPRTGRQVVLLENRGLLGGACEERLAFTLQQWPALAPICEELSAVHGVDNEPPCGFEPYQSIADPYRLLQRGQAAAVNLAQGDLLVETTRPSQVISRVVVSLLCLGLFLQLGITVAQGWYLQRQADYFSESSRALYKTLFPEDVRLVNIRAQFDEHLSQSNSAQQGRFFELLKPLSEVLQSMPSHLGVTQLNFDEGSGALALQVVATDFAQLELLRQKLSATGLAVQVGSASREGDGVTARVVLGDES